MLPGPARDRLEAAEAFAPEARPATAPRPPGSSRTVTTALLTSGLATVAMAGILEHAWLWLAAFVVLLADAPPADPPVEHEEDVWTLIDALDRAGATGQDLITAYV